MPDDSGVSDVQRIARLAVPIGPWGDTLKASFFGTQAVVYGSDSIATLDSVSKTDPEALFLSQTKQLSKKKAGRISVCGQSGVGGCSSGNCSNGGGPVLVLNKAGDIALFNDARSFSDSAINYRFGDIPPIQLPSDSTYYINPFQGIPPDMQADDGSQGGYPLDGEDTGLEATPVGFWDSLNNMFTNDCDKVCRDAATSPRGLDQSAYNSCKRDCDKSNQGLTLDKSIANLTKIILIGIAGIIIIAIGIKAAVD